MGKKQIYLGLGLLSLIASAVMYFVGDNSSHLSELKDFFYIPLPLSGLFLWLGVAQK